MTLINIHSFPGSGSLHRRHRAQGEAWHVLTTLSCVDEAAHPGALKVHSGSQSNQELILGTPSHAL